MRRILLGFGIAVAILLILVVLLVKTWGTSYAWSVASGKARDFGIELTREDLSWNWNGGLGFTLRLRGVGVRTLKPGALSFDLKVANVDVSAAFLRAENLAVVEELTVTGITGRIAFAPEVAADPKSDSVEDTPARVPDLRTLEMEIPKPPLDVELRALKVDARDLEVDAGKLGFAKLAAFAANGALTWKKDAFALRSATMLDARDVKSESAAVVTVGAVKADVKLDGAFVAIVGEKLKIALKPDAKVEFASLAGKTAQGLAPRARQLLIEARLTDGGPFLKINGAGVEGIPGVPGAVGLSAEIAPKIADGGDVRIDLDADAPGLLRAKGWLQIPRELARAAASVKGDLTFEARGNLFTIFVPEWPSSLASSITGNLKIERSSAETATVIARVSSAWLRLALNARARVEGTEVRDADADGSLQVSLPRAGVKWKHLRVGGGLRIPLKLLFRDGERFYVESDMEFRALSFRQPGLAFEGVDGAVFISQSWAARKASWRMAPVHAWNPFSRVDLASSETLDPDQKTLSIARISYGDKTVGPLRMSASFRQNQLFVPSWSLACPQGRFQGVLLMDVRPDQPRMGLSFNAIEVDLAGVLPAAMTGGRKIANDPTSFVLNVDWDVARAQAFGNFDWLRMTPGQVHAALDIFDPLGEKPAFNMTRSMLATAYPTRVRMTMKGSVADTQISTNLVEIPPITNVAISPYLVKYREILFDIPLVKNYRTPEAP